MGAIAGIVRWDGVPIESAGLDRMARASAHRGPDGTCTRIGERAALAHLRFVTTDASDGDQPFIDTVRALWFVFDGRLDNRDDVLCTLGIADGALPDARLALEAFARWGSGTASRLLGDFAFIGWDDRRRRLVCARDHMGIRHLHYHSSPGLVVCATDLAQVLAHPSVPKAPNRAVAADYLACDVRNGAETLYRGVSRVPPGHSLVCTDRGVRLERYWFPEPRSAIRYARDAEYAEHCRDLLTRSVAARMRSSVPVSAMLSGGLDSSSVVCVAHRIVKDAGPPPRAFSIVRPDRPDSDERTFIDAVARHCGASVVRVTPGAIAGGDLHQQAAAWAATPAMPADAMAQTLYAAIREHGHRVTLTGAGGDFLFTGSVFQYADLLRELRVAAAIRRFVDDWHAGETGRSALGLLQAGVWPLLPPFVKNALRPAARYAMAVDEQPRWLLVDRRPADAFPAQPRGGSYATEDITRQVGCGMHAFFVECGERAAAASGIELRHPLLDVRLVDFALAIPDGQRKRGRLTKFILREALAADLPEEVRTRRTKADFSYVIADAIDSLGGERFFTDLQIAEAGWVDAPLVAAKYRKMRSQYARGYEVYGEHVPALWMIASVELWFRSAFGSRPASRVEAL
jgi:asparagine synthase (glutamine-hydrolysing)